MTVLIAWCLVPVVLIGHRVSPTQSRVEQEREACRAEKAALKRRMAEVSRDFEAAPGPATVEVLVELDGRIRALLDGRPSYRPCETDRELVYDPRWDAMGVKTDYWDDLTYTGHLLVVAHRRSPRSPFRAHTLFSMVLGETPWHGLGVMPDVQAAYAYEKEFPKGPFIADVHRILADFHKDLYMVLRDRRSDFKYDCFAAHIGPGSWQGQEDRARKLALEYYQRVLRLRPDDDGARTWQEETRQGTVRAWSFCAD